MSFPVTPNEYWTRDGVVFLAVGTKTFPDVIAQIDESDLERALDGKARWTAHRIRGAIQVHRSITIGRTKSQTELLHRHVIGAGRSHYPSIVHRDGDRTNCRRPNLIVTHPSGVGGHARHGRGSSKFKGVFLRKDSGRYRAMIQIRRVLMRLGTFDTEVEAALAYDAAARHHHGELALLNFSINR